MLLIFGRPYLNMVNLIIKLCFLFYIVKAREFSAEEYGAFPQLFDLQDYHGCLSQKDGIYCLGTFHLKPTKENDPVYNFMEQYSNNKFAFNRTLVHRGYCLNQHCPSNSSNSIQRFEECVKQWALDKGLYATLQKLDYCRSNKQLEHNFDPFQILFCIAILIILLLNIFGTMCDVTNNKVPERLKKVITLWSIRANWDKLTTIIYEQKDSRLATLAPMRGARVIMLAVAVLGHVLFVHYMTYLQNPQDMERDAASPNGVFSTNGTTLVQTFVIFSSFLCAYNMLLSADKKPILLSSMPKQILKRITRIAPVHLLLVGFGATWYAQLREGPLWPALVETEQDACRNKFWTHMLFINNIIEPEKKCYLPTWFLAVDMQLYIVALLLTIFLAKFGTGILKILFALYFSSLVSASVLAYIYGWESMLYIAVPETMHGYFNSPSFERFYMSPFGHMSSCLVGLILAHLQYTVQEGGFKLQNWKWLTYTHYLCIPIYAAWLVSGVYIREAFTSPIAVAAYVGIERLVFNISMFIIFFGIVNINTPLRRILAWHGWDFFARLSLPVVMIHWPVIMIIAASRPTLTYSTFLNIIVDSCATWTITYAMAVPVSVLIEIPMQRFLDYFIL